VEQDGGVALGIRGEFGSQKLKTRVFKEGGDKGDWIKHDIGLIANMGPVMKIFLSPAPSVALTMSVYYTFGLLKSNAGILEQSINNSSHVQERDDEFKNGNGLFGIGFTLSIFGS
jgi:hypothetical protein